jgi:hypothetical protein
MATTYVRLDSGVEISTSDPATVAVVYRLINTQVGEDDLEFLEPSQPWPGATVTMLEAL